VREVPLYKSGLYLKNNGIFAIGEWLERGKEAGIDG